MTNLFVVCLGGALGSGARYLVVTWATRAFGTAFPYGTLIVNVVGSMLLGAIMTVAGDVTRMSPTLRLALSSGLMGGFTTYSSFNYETTRMAQSGAYGMAALNIGLTLVVCLLSGALGMAGARALMEH